MGHLHACQQVNVAAYSANCRFLLATITSRILKRLRKSEVRCLVSRRRGFAVFFDIYNRHTISDRYHQRTSELVRDAMDKSAMFMATPSSHTQSGIRRLPASLLQDFSRCPCNAEASWDFLVKDYACR
jgi:hypothetical protein